MRLLIVGIFALLCSGCVTVPLETLQEPMVIVITNDSGVDLQKVSMRELDAKDPMAVRSGSISPVPQGASQVVFRPTDVRPFPQKAEISWVNVMGEEFSQVIALGEIVRNSDNKRPEALNIQILSGGDARWTVE